MKDDVQSLSHSKWRCKYHIVFAPKYRRQIIYGKIKADVGKILRELSERKGVEILEEEKIEVSCDVNDVKNVISKLKEDNFLNIFFFNAFIKKFLLSFLVVNSPYFINITFFILIIIHSNTYQIFLRTHLFPSQLLNEIN